MFQVTQHNGFFKLMSLLPINEKKHQKGKNAKEKPNNIQENINAHQKYFCPHLTINHLSRITKQ